MTDGYHPDEAAGAFALIALVVLAAFIIAGLGMVVMLLA